MNATTNIKAAVAASFSAAADTYEQGADVQREVAHKLAARIAKLSLPPRPRILEIGCGTGFLTRAVSEIIGEADWLVTDISAAMIERCRKSFPHARYAVMDGERPSLGAEKFDLICSSLAFQWFDDLENALPRLASLLAPGGYLAYATLAEDSFREWRETSPGARAYPSVVALGDVEDEHISRVYSDAHAFLDHWRQIGASLPAAGYQPQSPGALRRTLRRFENGFTATYHVAYGVISR